MVDPSSWMSFDDDHPDFAGPLGDGNDESVLNHAIIIFIFWFSGTILDLVIVLSSPGVMKIMLW